MAVVCVTPSSELERYGRLHSTDRGFPRLMEQARSIAFPLPLVRDGWVLRRNLRKEMLTLDDLMEQLREQGVEQLSEVRHCFLEGDGHLSVIRRKEGEDATPERKRVAG